MRTTDLEYYLQPQNVNFKNANSPTMCLYDQNFDMIILFAYLVGWLDSSPVEMQKKIKSQSLKTCLG